MDILIYLCLLAVIGIFFFFSLFPAENKSKTPYLFIIFFCSVFFILQMFSAPYIDVGTNVTVVQDGTGQITQAITQPIKQPIGNFNYILLLGNTAFFILAVLQTVFSKGNYVEDHHKR